VESVERADGGSHDVVASHGGIFRAEAPQDVVHWVKAHTAAKEGYLVVRAEASTRAVTLVDDQAAECPCISRGWDEPCKAM
jgi:hypothetical protein